MQLSVLSEEPFIAELKRSLAMNKGLQDRTINLFDSLNTTIDVISLGNEMKKDAARFCINDICTF